MHYGYLSNDDKLKTKINLNESELGSIYLSLKDYKNAYKYCFKAISELHVPLNEAVMAANIGELYLGLDSVALSEKWLNKAISICDQYTLVQTKLCALNTKVELYLKLKRYADLPKLVGSLEETIPQVDQLYNVYESYQILIEYYTKVKMYKKALDCYVEKEKIINKINQRESNQLVEEIEVKYESEKKDSQIIEQQNAINNRNTIIAISSTVVILIVVLLIIIILLQRKKTKLENINRHKLENELQLKTLQSKVIPHFTKNVLSAIGYLAMSDKLRISHYIAVFSRFTSLTLENADKNYNTLQNEIRYIENYLELEQLRFEDRFEYVVTIDSSIDLDVLIPSMALHTYCDNAIRHGLVNKQGVGKLVVEVGYKVKGILISVTDDGVGREKAISLGTRGNGMGLFLIDAQIEFYNTLNRDYITQKIIDLKDADGNALGTRIELFIPEFYKFE